MIMSGYPCPKCGGPMDPGIMSCTQGHLFHKSDTQGVFTMATFVDRSLACTSCGYVEFYLNPEMLRRHSGK